MTQYLTTQAVADRLGVSVFTIRRYIRAGKLRAVKLDGAYRLSREDLAEFLKDREIDVGGDPPPAPEPTPRGAEPGGASAEPTAHDPQHH